MQIEKILATAVKYQASDIYISVGIKPTLRIHGDLVPISEHPILNKTIAEEYLLEIMNDAQRKEFAEKFDLDFALDIPGLARFRVNLFIQNKGIGAVFRYIPSETKTLDDLNLPSQLKKIAEYKQGIVLVTGPTGQGKSTTLAAIIDEINRTRQCNIITIEDPIEFIHSNKSSIIHQREVGTHTKSFKAALRGALRESTDVILIGEMRDHETISLALTAAETGHLVVSTLHTSGAAKSIDRVIDSFPSDQQNQARIQLSESIRAIVWQQLIKGAAGNSRVAALEIMFANNAISNLIRKNKTYQISSVLETSLKDGMQTMKYAIEQLQNQGFINQKTALEYLQEFSNSLEDTQN
jgi:twitching motility protein PilT